MRGSTSEFSEFKDGAEHFVAVTCESTAIPGASRPGRLAEDVQAHEEKIPDDFWQELHSLKLVHSGAPLANGR